MKKIDMSKYPSPSKNISKAISKKFKKNEVKEGVDLVAMAKALAKRNLENEKAEEEGGEEE